jgi:hypothetical protein
MDCKIKRLHLQAINFKNGIKVFPVRIIGVFRKGKIVLIYGFERKIRILSED